MIAAAFLLTLVFPLFSNAGKEEKSNEKQQEEITRLRKKSNELLHTLFRANTELVAAKRIAEELYKENKKALLGNMALSKLITELIKDKLVPSLKGSVDPAKEELLCGEWILFNPKKINDEVCDESGFVCVEKIGKNFKPGIHINISEYFAWIYEPEEQIFYRQELKKCIPQQSIVLLDWE